MRKFYKTILAMVLVICMLSVSACSGEKPDEAVEKEVIKLRLAGQHAAEHPATEALNRIADKIMTDSNGEIEIMVYPSNQLGDYTLVYEEVMTGSIDMAHIFVPSQYDEKLEINSIPYLVENYEAMEKVFSEGSNFYRIYSELHQNLGVHLLGIYAEGFIGYGMKEMPENYLDPTKTKTNLVRTPAMDVYKLATEDMGYPSTTIAYADLYTALQTGVADGWVGGTALMNYLWFRDVVDYFIPYNIFVENTAYLINQETWNSLSSEHQAIIEEAFEIESKKSFEICESEEMQAKEDLIADGNEVIEINEEDRVALADYIRNTTWPKLEAKFSKEIMDELKKDVE